MKKIFAFVAAALVSLGAMAVDGVNVMAYGLKSVVNDDVTEMTINFSLNTAATALTVQFFDAAGDLAAEVELEDAALLTAGAHQTTVEIPLDELEEGESYTWGIVAEGGTTVFENKLPVGDPKYSFYLPQDVVVDNSFESEYFGNVYVSMPWEGESDGGTYTTKNQQRGIYIFDPTLATVNGADSALVAYDGGLGGDIHSRAGIKRLAIDEVGSLYISSRDAATKGVYRMDPAHPENPFVQVLEGTYAVDALEVVGENLYTIEDLGGESGGLINTYDMNTIPVGAPTKTWSIGEKGFNLLNSDESLRSDRNGGFWIIQHRYALDTYPALTHITKKGVRDFYVDVENNTDLLSNSDGGLTYRGTMGVSVDGSMIAISSNKRAVVFSVEYGDSIVLTKICETPVISGNIDGIAFDVAENLYVASASAEQFHMYPMAKEEGMNHSLVKAAARYEVTIPGNLPQAPETAPEAPTKDEADVMAVYCNHYATNTLNFNVQGWGGILTWQTLTIDGTNILACTDMKWEIMTNWDADHYDVSAYDYLHADIWAPADAKIKLTFEALSGTKPSAVFDLEAGWNAIDAPLSSWVDYNFQDMRYFILEGYVTPEGASFEDNPLAFANVYFWKEPTSVENVAAETKAVKVVRDGQVLILRNGVEYNLLGSEMK